MAKGNRGGKSSAWKQKIDGLTIDGQDIVSVAEPYLKQYKYVGIRTQDEDFQIGDIDHKSSVWRSGDETNKKLSGISATNVKSEAVAAHSDIKKNFKELNKYKNSGFYFGDNVAIIVSNDATRGGDVGELIMKNAKVVKILKRG